MNFIDLKQHLQKSELAKCYLLVGDDNYLLKSAVKQIENTVNLEFPELNYNKFEGQSTTNDIVLTLDMLPFMTKKRLVVVREYYPLMADLNALSKKFLQSDCDSAVLVIYNAKIFENFSKVADKLTIVDCSHLDMSSCAGWIIKKFGQKSIVVDNRDAQLLAEYCMLDMSTISMQCDKLLDYLETGERLSRELIEQTVEKQDEYKTYEFSEAIAAKNSDKAYIVMEKMLQGGTSETALLANIYSQFRNMFYISISKEADSLLSKKLSISDFVVRKLRGLASKYTPKKLKQILAFVSETEFKLKSGALTGGTFFKFLTLKLINI